MNDSTSSYIPQEFLAVPVVHALHEEISKYKVKKKTLLDKDKDIHAKFGVLWNDVLRAATPAALKKVCAALVALTNELKVERKFPFLTSGNVPQKTLGHKIEKILETSDVAAQYFVFHVMTELKRYKARNPADTEIMEQLEAELSELKTGADVVRLREYLVQRIHREIAKEVQLTHDQQSLLFEINRYYFAHQIENSQSVAVVQRAIDWGNFERKESRRYEKERAKFKAREAAKAQQFLQETLADVGAELEKFAEAVETEQENSRRIASQSLADIADAAAELEKIHEKIEANPETKLSRWDILIDQKTQEKIDAENALKDFYAKKEKARASLNRSLDLRIGFERNVLVNWDIDLQKVDRKVRLYSNESTRISMLNTVSQKWWDKIPLIRALPNVRTAYEERRARIQLYFDTVLAMGRIVTSLALPDVEESEMFARENMVMLSQLATEHDPLVCHSLLSDFDVSQQRIREYFHYHEQVKAKEAVIDTVKRELSDAYDAKLAFQAQMYGSTLQPNVSQKRPGRD